MPLTLCGPAVVQIAFTVTQVIIDIYRGVYNTAFIKLVTMSVIALALNVLCDMGASLVAWLIVFVPFMSMTIMTILIAIAVGTEKRHVFPREREAPLGHKLKRGPHPPGRGHQQGHSSREHEWRRNTSHRTRDDERRHDDADWHSGQERRWEKEAAGVRREDDYIGDSRLENVTGLEK